MMNKLAWVVLLALWISTFRWMNDLEMRQRMQTDEVNKHTRILMGRA